MSEITLTGVVASHSDLERMNLFAGRHLGEDEFDRLQAYSDRRLAPLLAAMPPGVLQGLEVRTSHPDRVGESFTVSPGLAIAGNGQSMGLFYPLHQRWSSLIEDYLQQTGAASAAGIFFLTLNRRTRHVDADPEVDPCQRADFDPTRDSRLVVVGSLGLKRLALNTDTNPTRERIENWVAANHVDSTFLGTLGHSVPIGLLAVAAEEEGYQVSWFSGAAGHYRSLPDSGYHVLLNQVRDASRRLLLAASSAGEPAQEYLENNLHLDFLPAAGELPVQLLRNVASPSPGIAWLPQHLGIDMVAVPENSVLELIERHLPRRVIDLRQPAGDRVRLLLAVGEDEYRPDLLDFPQTDDQLERDLYRHFMRAYDGWKAWADKFNQLYFLHEEDVLEPETLQALDLPQLSAPPQRAESFFAQVVDTAREELGVDNDDQPLYPYNQGLPEYPAFYRRWANEDPETPGELLPPALEEPPEDGLIIQYTIAQRELEAVDNQIRAQQARLEKTRDYLLLQRQQLDNQTVSLTALAGGVAGDGSGLQVARWLPFTKLKARDIRSTEQSEPETEPTDLSQPRDLQETIERTSISTATAPLTGTSSLISTSQPLLSSFSPSGAPLSSTTKTLSSTISGLGSTNIKDTGNLIFASSLRQNQATLSSLQLNMNNLRLNHISQIPKQALTRPAFETKEFRFGVLEHIQPEIQEYKKAFRSMAELRITVNGLFDASEAKIILAYFNRLEQPKSYDELLDELQETLDQEEGDELSREQLAPKIYEALFEMGRILTLQIAYMESRYSRIEAQLEGRLRSRINREARIDKLITRIRNATEELVGLDKRRVDLLGDYGLVQRLIDDDWLNVHRKTQERAHILTNGIKGLYYVRARQASISLPLADPLALRYSQHGDPVPGCDWETDPELPGPVEEFFDTVLEIPMEDWSALRDLKNHIPALPQLDYIAALRKTRLVSKASKQTAVEATTAGPIAVSLASLRQQTKYTLQQISHSILPTSALDSVLQRQTQAAKSLSLEDLLSGTKGLLHRQAQTLHNRLEQASCCMLEKLEELPPSLRLQWAQLAEDDRLPVERVEQWPGLERAERSDFNTTRTLAELIAWWFRQLEPKASATALNAMRNMVRANLIHAALGDPVESLRGAVQVPPRTLALGEPLRLQLNQAAKPGTHLQLLDPQQRVVALLSVDDHDTKGTLARVTQVTVKDAKVSTQYQVVSSKTNKLYSR